MFTRAIVRPPSPNFSDGLTTGALGLPNFERALEQHEAYCAALEQCGLTLTRLEPDPDYPDSTFVEDTAVITECYDETSPRCAVLTRPGASSRRGEVSQMREVVADFCPVRLEIRSPGTVDGGDVCLAGNHIFIGLSGRTNESGAQQLAEMLAPFGYESTFVDIRKIDGLLHLKSGLAYLGRNRLAITEPLLHRNALSDYELIRVNADEQYAANCILVNDYLLVAAGFEVFAARLRELGYKIIALDMSEFEKMDGGLSCLSLRF